MKKSTIALLIMMSAASWAFHGGSARAQQAPADGPRYASGTTNLLRPADYREWIFLGAGLGMTYQPPSGGGGSQSFTNVFVNPSSYRSFMQTGRWPDKTVFVLEARASGTDAEPNLGGRFQTNLAAIEAEVKDSRFPDGWAFFDFGRADALRDSSEPLSGQRVAACIECHTKHTAVERTFVQFYPTLLEVARRMKTVKPGF
jgi:cytochrome c553